MRQSHPTSASVEPLESRQLMTAVPTDHEQYMLELINRARANPTAEAARYGIALNEGLSAGTISSDPKQPLAFDASLITSARGHSQWMIDNDTFSHTGDQGSDPGDRMGDAGYSQTGSFGWGENIAYRSESPGTPEPVSTTAQEHSDLFIDEGIAGRGHRLNLLDADFKEIGVGIATGRFNAYNALMTTQDFAYEDGDSFLTGVAYTDAVTHDDFYTPGEGINNLTISATRDGDSALFTTTTWSTGGYSLQLPPGSYTITASGTSIEQPLAYTGVVVANQNVKRDFVTANVNPTPEPTPTPDPTPAPTPSPTPTPTAGGSISGRLYNDLNGNGKKDGTEPGTSGLRVFLDSNSNGTVDDGEVAMSPAGDGTFHFDNVAAGTQHVRVEGATGWRITLPTIGVLDAVVKAGKITKLKPLAATQSVRLTGSIFDDANGNGTLDTGEVAAKKRKVYADINNNGVYEKGEPTVSTDKIGNWVLSGLNPGTITLRVVVKKGYSSTLENGAFNADAPTGGQTYTGFMLGEQKVVLAQRLR